MNEWMNNGTNEVNLVDLKPEHEPEVPSLSLFLSGWAQGGSAGNQEPMAVWPHRVALCFWKFVPFHKPSWSLSLLLSLRFVILKILCLCLPPQHLWRRAAVLLFLCPSPPISWPSPLLWLSILQVQASWAPLKNERVAAVVSQVMSTHYSLSRY